VCQRHTSGWWFVTMGVDMDSGANMNEAATRELADKYRRLREDLQSMGRVIVAFSAGVDSTLLLKVSIDTLGRDNVLAVTGVSPSLAQRELAAVKELAGQIGAHLELIETTEMDDPKYTANSTQRCYFCKLDLFGKLRALGRERGYGVVLNGLNVDDTGDFRPGTKAGKELAVRSPLLEAGLTKAQVRELSRELGLPTWQKPALACLASRIPYGSPVTIQSLKQVELGEEFLYGKGLSGLRVRHHGKVARIEVQVEDMGRLLADPLRGEVIARMKELGFTYVTVDLQGFRSGSGNEVIVARE